MDSTWLPERFPASVGLVTRAVYVLCALTTVGCFYRLYRVRTLFRDLAQKHGIPMIPHSFWFGHLKIVLGARRKHPVDLVPMTLPDILAKEYPDVAAQGLLYIDTWPLSGPLLAVLHPDMAAQFMQNVFLPRHYSQHITFFPLTGCKDILNSEGQEWKKWRTILNPGFSAKNLMALVPSFLEDVDAFRNWLGTLAMTGEVAGLDAKATALTADIIGRATLGVGLDCQTREHPLLTALRKQADLLLDGTDPLSMARRKDPRRTYRMWKNERVIRRCLAPLIERAAATHRHDGSPSTGPTTIMSLAIKAYVDDFQPAKGSPDRVDPDFVDIAIAQFKIFILAGHDTTSASLCFAYYMLDMHPEALETVRREHDEVLGKDPSRAREMLSANPQLLNQLPYTAAVIKESMRLFPPVAGGRQGTEDFFLTHPDTGARYPTAGTLIMSCHMSMHHSAAFWPRPDEFVPGRWLAREGEALHVRNKNAFRPFELGPRRCIGQELAQLEMRAILAMTVREFDIHAVYGSGDPEYRGHKCYPSSEPGKIAVGHPAKGLPVTVTRRAVSV